MSEHEKVKAAIENYKEATLRRATALTELNNAGQAIVDARNELGRVIAAVGGKPVIYRGRRYAIEGESGTLTESDCVDVFIA